MIQIVDRNGRKLDDTINTLLQEILKKIQGSGKLISDALKFTTQRHFQIIYPNSTHYSPNKVTTDKFANGVAASGSIEIDVPGITRAYKDLHIKPVHAKYLTIPLHRDAYGKRASSFDDLFVVTKKDGRKFLAKQNHISGITMMYRLVKNVFQRQDKRLMPTTKTYADNILSRIGAYISKTKI